MLAIIGLPYFDMKNEYLAEVNKIKVEIKQQRALLTTETRNNATFNTKRKIISDIRNLQIKMADYQKGINEIKP